MPSRWDVNPWGRKHREGQSLQVHRQVPSNLPDRLGSQQTFVEHIRIWTGNTYSCI